MSLKNNKSIILMSGGLDSLAALSYTKNKNLYDIKLAITFDYGQKSAEKEIESSSKIANFYKIEHKVIKLNWLKDITHTGLVSQNTVPTTNLNTRESAKKVWVPNRNALFLNIAAAFCDSLEYKYIIFGANKDEGETFPDNTEAFRKRISGMFKYSTLVQPEVTAPLINFGKDDIVKIAVETAAPIEFVWSCYSGGEKHCGECESCKHLKRALLTNQCEKYIKELF